MPVRYDAFQIDDAKTSRTPSGGVRVDALLTRPGVFTYHDAAGKPIREYRPPEEVYAADSMASLADAAVTNRHPKAGVNADNWKALSMGHVSNPRKDESGRGVAAQVIVAPADAVRKVGTEFKEVSCGYSVDLDFTPGVTPDGERYDAVQRNIRYNHVGLGPSGWGRQGPQSALRLDSAGDEIIESPSQEQGPKIMKIKHDGIIFEGATDAEVQAKIDAHDAAKGASGADAALQAERGKNAALETQLADAKKRADEAPAIARAALEARGKLEAKCSPVLGKTYAFDGKTDREVKLALVQKHDGKFTGLGADGYAVAGDPCADAFLEGVFSIFASKAPEAGSKKQDTILSGLSAGARPAPHADGSPSVGTVKNDGADRANPSATLAREKMFSNLGKRPAPAAK